MALYACRVVHEELEAIGGILVVCAVTCVR
jgi:hypothetical protein